MRLLLLKILPLSLGQFLQEYLHVSLRSVVLSLEQRIVILEEFFIVIE